VINHPETLVESHRIISSLYLNNQELLQKNQELEQQVAWFKKQIFGQKSEKILWEKPNAQQLSLGEQFEKQEPVVDKEITVKSYTKTKVIKEDSNNNDAQGLRFSQEVKVEEILLPLPPECEGKEYEVIDTRVTHTLAQTQSSYFVKRYLRPIVKIKETNQVVNAAAKELVLERSFADTTFLAGILVDKFSYYLPLYRIHQRLSMSGITISRSTLTNYVHRVGELLTPVYEALIRSIASSKLVAMDETPIKAGRKGEGKMHQGYFWSLYGDKDEVGFVYFDTRALSAIKAILGEVFEGTLLTDGYAAYQAYVKTMSKVIHALCWAHIRREFFEAQESQPACAIQALEIIARLYQVEEEIRGSPPEKRLQTRREKSQPLVDEFFEFIRKKSTQLPLLPSNPFLKACNYAIQRQKGLIEFLSNPDIPLDTNHLERALRPLPMGRKNWLFCWTEVGAKYVAVIQSLIASCKTANINPFDYFCDILPRLDSVKMSEVDSLLPRNWKLSDHP